MALSPEAGGFSPGGWAAPSVLRERQGQGSLEGGFLIDAVVLEDRKWSWAGGFKGTDQRASCASDLRTTSSVPPPQTDQRYHFQSPHLPSTQHTKNKTLHGHGVTAAM